MVKGQTMQTKLTGWLSLLCLILTVLWLVLLIVGLAGAGPLDTFDRALAYASTLGLMAYLTYANAALITIVAVMLYHLLYQSCREDAPEWAFIGLGFVPIYGALNLMVYLSQITVVPQLMQLQALPEYHSTAAFLLRQALQIWPASAISIVNNLAYAILGIPSVIFGILLMKKEAALRIGGVLLAVNGVACIAGFIGIVAQIPWLSQGSLLGGVLFLLALIPLSWAFLHPLPQKPPPSVPVS
jgi:hypothetical protein